MSKPSSTKNYSYHETSAGDGTTKGACREYKTQDSMQGISRQQRFPGAGNLTRDEAQNEVLELQVPSFSFVRSRSYRHRVQEHGRDDGRYAHQIESGATAEEAPLLHPRMVSTAT